VLLYQYADIIRELKVLLEHQRSVELVMCWWR